MKEKKVLKLSLNKKTIAHLEMGSMDSAKGGRPRESIDIGCESLYIPCPNTICQHVTLCGC